MTRAINTFSYCLVNGKTPKGRGTWRFIPGDGAGHAYNDIPPFVTSPNALYSQACRNARRAFAGYPDIYVLP